MPKEKLPFSLYNGEIQGVFDDEKHSYTIDGVKRDSVTTITSILDKPFLKRWMLKVAADYVRKELQIAESLSHELIDRVTKGLTKEADRIKYVAAGLGTDAHDWISQHIKSQIGFYDPPGPPSDIIKPSIEAFLERERRLQPKYIYSERIVFSRTHDFIGTLDILEETEFGRGIVDNKTSGGLYPEYYLQLAGYGIAYQEEFPNEKLDYHQPIRIDKKTGELEEGKLNPITRFQDEFLAARMLQRFLKENQY